MSDGDVTERFFVAALLDEAAYDTIDNLPTKAQRGVKWTRRMSWHITLRFLGECEIGPAIAALAAVDAAAPTATLGPEVTLLGERVLMVPVGGLDSLAESVTSAFDGVGEPQGDRPFLAHLTLARLKGHPLRHPESISVLGHEVDVSWQVGEIVLVKSELKPEGAEHSVVATRQLS